MARKTPPEPTTQSVTFLTPDDLAPILTRLDALEAGAVELEHRVADHDTLLQDHEARIDLLEAGEPVPPDPGEPSDGPPPDKTTWDANMIEWGITHGDTLFTTQTIDFFLSHIYYDAARVHYQIAEYTGNPEPWRGYAKQAARIYRDQYVLPNNAAVPGYENFTTGLRLDYEQTGDEDSKRAVILLSQNAMFAADWTDRTYVARHTTSREVAYAILAYVNAEALGEATRPIRAEWVTRSHAYIGQWRDQANWGTDSICPFMMAITAQALIADWEETEDARCLPALQQLADFMWPLAWHAPTSALKYQINPTSAEGFSTVGAPDLSMLIAPWLSWLWRQTGDDRYREQFDALLYSHKDAYLAQGKQFDQNFWWAFDGMRWREEGSP